MKFKAVTAQEVVELPAGVTVKLSDRQAYLRQHAIEDLGKGAYLTEQTVQFKAGEELEIFEEDIQKMHLKSFGLTEADLPGATSKPGAKPGAKKKATSKPGAKPGAKKKATSKPGAKKTASKE